MRKLEYAKPLTAAAGGRRRTRRPAAGSHRNCPHPSSRWAHGPGPDYRICVHCLEVLEEGWPDHHPEISRWLNEGGAA